jgi:hypothetical protein
MALILLAGTAQAAGILYTTDDGNPTPFTWDMSSGPIPAWTDGGAAFTYDFDGVTPFITIERADEITQFALDQWSDVPTSTFEAHVVGTIESQTGIADVTGENAGQFYGVQNGYGMWVLYDTEGDILEDFFGVPRTSILGFSFPEYADANGNITESTTLLNGWYVSDEDIDGERVAGVFTHELGHAINLGHTQVNGPLAYYSYPFSPRYPGVKDCGVEPIFNWNYPPTVGQTADPYQVETMYPFIGSLDEIGKAMSYVTMPDDIASISNLYPTPDYFSSTGTITGTLYLKDQKTEFIGVNVVARNVNDPTGDAVSQLTGQATQGKLGPDGRFTIHGLTPGAEYVLYIEQIVAGGFSPNPTRLASLSEYWNTGEDNLPSVDDPCDSTPILAEAGVTKTADFYFNGYVKGIDYTPIGPFFLVDLAKNGKASFGSSGSTPFVWEENKGVYVIPNATTTAGAMNRNGTVVAVESDPDGDGIGGAGLWTQAGGFQPFGYLGETECGGSSSAGVNSSGAWAMSDDAKVVAGLAYWDRDGDGICQRQSVDPPEINGFVWTQQTGMQVLSMEGYGRTPAFVRAHGMSGNGRVILGTDGNSRALAWVDGGPVIDLYTMVGAREAYAADYDGTRVALGTNDSGVILWNPRIEGEEAFTPIGGLTWCVDLDYVDFFGRNFCELLGPEAVQEALGPIPVLPTDMTDNGEIIIGRAGSFFTGFVGAFWSEATGWMNWRDFFLMQGVAEAQDLPMDNPISISASGSEIVGGLAGSTFTWLVNIDQIYVCQNGRSIQTGFPNGMFAKLGQGALFGRCEHIDDPPPPSPGRRPLAFHGIQESTLESADTETHVDFGAAGF